MPLYASCSDAENKGQHDDEGNSDGKNTGSLLENELNRKPGKPGWLRVKLPIGESYRQVRNLVDTHKLHTICESGNCPNMGGMLG